MTNSFLDDLYLLVQDYAWEFYEKAGGMARDNISTVFFSPDVEEVVKTLKKDILKKKGRFDIELLLEALNNLDNKDHILYSIFKYPKKYEKYDKQYVHLKNILLRYIRNQCEDISSVNYLYPISAFKHPNTPLSLFTLNYDGAIEKMCKENDINFTDGFKEEWNPNHFLDDNLHLRLYKLHGSLYWYKTEKGKYIKLPIKNVKVEQLIYFMDEKISETLIWPMITKDYSTGPFPWLMEEFRKQLRTYDLCVVLGYSFRDNYIRQMVLDGLQNNTNLWLLIVDHNSKEIKEQLCGDNAVLQSRIMIMDNDIEKALSYRVLKNRHTQLGHARDQEGNNMNVVISVKSMLVSNWMNVFNIYRRIQHYDRIKYIVKDLLANFQADEYEAPSLQWAVFDLSLLYSIEYYLKGNIAELNYWLNIFRECSYVLDWSFSRDIEDDLSISSSKLPKWAEEQDPQAYSSHFRDFTPMFDVLGKCLQLTDNEKDIQGFITAFFNSLHYYEPIQGDVAQRRANILEMNGKGLLWHYICDRLISTIHSKLVD